MRRVFITSLFFLVFSGPALADDTGTVYVGPVNYTPGTVIKSSDISSLKDNIDIKYGACARVPDWGGWVAPGPTAPIKASQVNTTRRLLRDLYVLEGTAPIVGNSVWSADVDPGDIVRAQVFTDIRAAIGSPTCIGGCTCTPWAGDPPANCSLGACSPLEYLQTRACNPPVSCLGQPTTQCVPDPTNCGGATCGANGCESAKGEDQNNCCNDCGCPAPRSCVGGPPGACQGCDNNGTCEPGLGENNSNCAGDCYCGNGTVEAGDGEQCEPPSTPSCTAACQDNPACDCTPWFNDGCGFGCLVWDTVRTFMHKSRTCPGNCDIETTCDVYCGCQRDCCNNNGICEYGEPDSLPLCPDCSPVCGNINDPCAVDKQCCSGNCCQPTDPHDVRIPPLEWPCGFGSCTGVLFCGDGQCTDSGGHNEASSRPCCQDCGCAPWGGVTCQADGTCTGIGPGGCNNNGSQDNGESGVDCGGGGCAVCPCNNNGSQDNGETGTDCGGGGCPACLPGDPDYDCIAGCCVVHPGPGAQYGSIEVCTANCPGPCGVYTCGANGCEGGLGENQSNCCNDCGCPGGLVCQGNPPGTCNPPPSSCPNSTCEPGNGENCFNCADCVCGAFQYCNAGPAGDNICYCDCSEVCADDGYPSACSPPGCGEPVTAFQCGGGFTCDCNPFVACSCSAYSDVGCGNGQASTGFCSTFEMYQTRTCNDVTCGETRCVADPSCGTSCSGDGCPCTGDSQCSSGYCNCSGQCGPGSSGCTASCANGCGEQFGVDNCGRTCSANCGPCST